MHCDKPVSYIEQQITPLAYELRGPTDEEATRRDGRRL